MTVRTMIAAALGAALLAAPVLAQSHDQHRGGHGGAHSRGGAHGGGHQGGPRPGGSGHHAAPGAHRPPPRAAGHGAYRPGVQSHAGFRRWRRGERFNYRYAHYYRVVPDWRRYRLYAPPRGYHWVRSGDDAVLVAITGGLIAAVIADRIH